MPRMRDQQQIKSNTTELRDQDQDCRLQHQDQAIQDWDQVHIFDLETGLESWVHISVAGCCECRTGH